MLAGHLNPKQGDPPEYPVRRSGEFGEIAVLLEAGFTTAANLEACNPPASQDNCRDYILAGPGLTQESFVVADLVGDYRMLVADVGVFDGSSRPVSHQREQSLGGMSGSAPRSRRLLL